MWENIKDYVAQMWATETGKIVLISLALLPILLVWLFAKKIIKPRVIYKRSRARFSSFRRRFRRRR